MDRTFASQLAPLCPNASKAIVAGVVDNAGCSTLPAGHRIVDLLALGANVANSGDARYPTSTV